MLKNNFGKVSESVYEEIRLDKTIYNVQNFLRIFNEDLNKIEKDLEKGLKTS